VDPANLQKSLDQVDTMLASVEPEVRRRARLLLSEVIARSSGPRRERGASIQIGLAVFPRTVRIGVRGRGLLMPSSATEGRPSYPHWVLNDLADRWGRDRRGDDFGMWFLLHRRDD
jgi:hypothetical protein